MKCVPKKTLFILAALTALILYFFVAAPKPAENINWGVNFSQKHAQALGLDWKETYLALMDDLQVKHLKAASYWDLLEPEQSQYRWEDLDWQVEQAEKRGVKLMLVIGMKTPRWPECHIPQWAKDLSKEEQQEKILRLVEATVSRYKDSSAIQYWQVENEPFFPFGDCPWVDKEFLKKEIASVKKIDSRQRPVVISDSGEGSFWISAAKTGDVVGTTMYKKVWVKQLKIYFTYPFTPTFYWRKAQIIKKVFGKDVMVVELQAEPWGPELLYSSPLKEQEKSMNPERFKGITNFARRTGLKDFYLWGGEWWFWMKAKQNQPEIWNEAKLLFE